MNFANIKNFRFLFIILATFLLVIMIEPYLTIEKKVFFASISQNIRNILLFLLPFLIFPLIASSITSVRSKGLSLVVVIIISIFVSNFIAIIIGYMAKLYLIDPVKISGSVWQNNPANLLPTGKIFSLFNPITIECSSLIGLMLGILSNYLRNEKLDKFISFSYKFIDFFLQKIMMPAIPFYIFGVMIKIQHETNIKGDLLLFGRMFANIILIQLSYLFLLFMIGSKFSLNKTFKRLKNSVPAVVTSFSTMSRMISLPVIMNSAEKNSEDKNLPRLTVPLIINAHALGECISLPIILLTIMQLNHLPIPEFSTYLHFALVMTLAQFTAVSVPGGSLLVLMPFLDQFFKFSGDMVGLIFAFDIFFDFIGTSANCLGDLAFINIIELIWGRIKNIGKKTSKNS